MRKKLLIIVAIVLAVLAFIGVLAPSFVEERVEQELADRLKSRGINASWTDFSSSFGRSFLIEGFVFDDPNRGIQAKASRVEISISIESIINAEVYVSAVQVEDLDVLVDLNKRGSQGEGTPTSGPKSSGLLQRILENPPEVDLLRGRFELRHGEMPLAELIIPETKVDLSWSSVDMESTAHLKMLASVPEFLATPMDMLFKASLDLDSRDLSFSFHNLDPQKPLVQLAESQTGSITIGSLNGQGNMRAGTLSVDAEELSLRIGHTQEAGGLVAAMDARAARLTRSEVGRISLALNGPNLILTPARAARLKPLIQLIADTRDVLQEPAKPTVSGKAPKRSDAVLKGLTLFSKVLHKFDIQMRDLQLVLNVESDSQPNVFTQLTLLERLDVFTSGGSVQALGESANGTIRANLDFLPGSPWPRLLVVDLKDVQLGKIPGMPKGRTELPSRGTSGRVDGTVTANLTLRAPSMGVSFRDPIDAVQGTATFHWKDGEADFVGVSDEPLTHINLRSSLDLTWFPARSHVVAKNGQLKVGAVNVKWEGEAYDFPLNTTFRASAAMDEIECEKAIRAFPAGMLGPYRNIKIDGKWAPTFSLYFPIHKPRAVNFEIEGYEEVCDIVSLGVPRASWPEEVKIPGMSSADLAQALSDVHWLEKPFVKRVTEGLVSEESEVYVGPGLPSYVPLNEMPSWVGGAAYLSEEILFYTAHGISPGLIKKALRLNLERGRFVYGGSTVTQQLIKNLFLSRDKTLSRKLQEALVAWRVTEVVPKDRVLELYLNCIEFGPDIYGIGPAAQYYFQKDARQLTPMEAIFLAMLKPSPLYGARIIQRGTTPGGVWWTKRTEELFRRLVEYKHVTQEQADAAKPYELKWENGKYAPGTPFIPLFD